MDAAVFGGMAIWLIVVLVFSLGLLIFNIVTSIWAYRDAKRKEKSELYCLVVLIATLFFPIIGFIVYLFIRND